MAVQERPLQQLLRLCGQRTDIQALPSMTDLLEGAQTELLQTSSPMSLMRLAVMFSTDASHWCCCAHRLQQKLA